jgi:hypothetical protein
VVELHRGGFPSAVVSPQAVEMRPDTEGGQTHKSRLGASAIVGGLIGGIGGILLTYGVSMHVNIVTGGMPIVSAWPFGIIVFEMTALGAILGTLGRMIYESGLGRPGALDVYDPAVSDGKIVIAVRCDDDSGTAAARHALAESGAGDLRYV